jgi:hypothetical protein
MKVGDLVKITRPSIGVPKDTLGLITAVTEPIAFNSQGRLFFVQLPEHPEWGAMTRRYLRRDLELISENAALWTSAKTAEA